MKKLFLMLLGLALAVQSGFAAETPSPVKYVFLFIGDGLSLPQRMVTEDYRKIVEGKGLLINSLETQGYSTTFAANQLITDSAASGTAIACGSKTNIGWLGLDAQGNRIESIASVAKDNGRKVGILTSVSLDHATPAAFYAHNASRGNTYDIALEIFDSGFDLFAGGGFLNADGKNVADAKGNIFDLAKQKGWVVSRTKEEFNNLKPTDKTVLAVTPRFSDSFSIPYSIDMNDDDLTLADFTAKAIELLDNDNGFFIMVEGGKIDWMCHANDAATTIHEVIAFDDAVKVAYDFAQKHPDETLIVITGDHETGGLTLGFSGTGYQSYLDRLQHQNISLINFQPIYRQVKDNKEATFEDVKPLVTQYFGLKFDGDDNDNMKLTEYEVEKLKEGFKRSRGEGEYSAAENKTILYGGYDPFLITLLHVLNNKAGIAWTSFAHTAMPVATSAYGKNAEIFGNMSDNTDIAKRLKMMVTKLK